MKKKWRLYFDTETGHLCAQGPDGQVIDYDVRVSVRDFGAVGNGVADDTDAIQAAIDACFAAGGGTVFFPNGTYRVGGDG